MRHQITRLSSLEHARGVYLVAGVISDGCQPVALHLSPDQRGYPIADWPCPQLYPLELKLVTASGGTDVQDSDLNNLYSLSVAVVVVAYFWCWIDGVVGFVRRFDCPNYISRPSSVWVFIWTNSALKTSARFDLQSYNSQIPASQYLSVVEQGASK